MQNDLERNSAVNVLGSEVCLRIDDGQGVISVLALGASR